MDIKLTKLYSTLCMISVKGEDAKLMATCLTFIEQTIGELKAPKKPSDPQPTPEENKEV